MRYLVSIIRYSVYLILFTPLIFSFRFYYPFSGLKSLYFMGGCQVIFVAWLFLILKGKKYQPRLNLVTLALTLFLIALILSSIFSVDFSKSFWSTFERMTGLLMLIHLFGFFLVLSSVFKTESDWRKIFIVSISVAILVSVISYLDKAGIGVFKLSVIGGSTLGNPSFMGSYLLFNIFLALYLFLKNKGRAKIYSGVAMALMVPTLFLEVNRAAYLSLFGGLVLLFFLYLTFIPRRKRFRILGKFLLVVSLIAFLVGAVLLFQSGSFVNKKFIEMTTKSRFILWQIAWRGFQEKPLLGWGLENFDLIFIKHFNPCAQLLECGGEWWLDRAHNVILDTLVTAGILGILAYLSIFLSAFYVLWRKYLRNRVGFFAASVFSVLLISYLVQNLTIFDIVSSYMMFFLILGFVGYIANTGKKEKGSKKFFLKNYHTPLTILLLIALCFTFFKFIIQPLKTDFWVVKAFRAQDSQERIENYQKALEASPLGKYQIREFFAQISWDFVEKNFSKIPKEVVKKEFNFVIKQLEKTREESFLSFRSILLLSHIHSVYGLIDSQKLSLAEKYGREVIELSPTNQQGYWALAQVKIYQHDFVAALSLAEQAIELEPRLFTSYELAALIAEKCDNKDKAIEFARKAIEVDPEWEGGDEFERFLRKEGIDSSRFK